MLDSGGGGGYTGTDWSSVSVIDMWLAVGNQETGAHWELLTGWRRSYELTLQHMAQVKGYRENLAAAWPPEKSPASAAYIARLDDLIVQLQHTYDAAVANHSAFSGATLALSSARSSLEKVVNEYVANEGKLATFENEQEEAKSTGGLMKRPALKPPVADGRQLQLESQARAIMYGLSSELNQARAKLAKPPPYDPRKGVSDDKEVSGNSGFSPPAIPPVVAYDPYSASSAGATVAHPGKSSSTGGPTASASPVRQPGLVLGGIDPPVGNPPGGLPSPSPGGGPMPVGGPTVVPGGGPMGLPVTPGVSRGLGADALPKSGRATMPSTGVKAMPPGGIIGGMPGMGLGQPAGGLRGPQQVSPVGGVIAPGTPNAASASRSASTAGHPVANLAGRAPSGSVSRAGDKPWDPDNPWETAEGVPPIVRPAAEQPIDPGPAIGLP